MELELKSTKRIEGALFCNCSCGEPATLLAEIGLIHIPHGSFFDICDEADCLGRAFYLAERRIENYMKHKKQINELQDFEWSKEA